MQSCLYREILKERSKDCKDNKNVFKSMMMTIRRTRDEKKRINCVGKFDGMRLSYKRKLGASFTVCPKTSYFKSYFCGKNPWTCGFVEKK